MEEPLVFTRLMEALDDYGQEVKRLYQARLISDGKKATGNLINNINVLIANTAMGLEYEVFLQLEDYWKYVEKGRRAGKFPPVDKILEWIRVKPIVPRPMANGKLPTENQLAFLIGRKIARDGIPAGNQLMDTVEAVNAYYMPRLEKALKEDWEEYSIYVLKDIDKMIRI